MRVTVTSKDGSDATVVLRKNRHGEIEKEARIFRLLKTCGLPVPEVLMEPFKNEQGESVAVYSLLPGENLQKLAMKSDKDLSEAKELLIESVTKLIETTDLVRQSEIGKELPELTLATELGSVKSSDSPWIKEKVYINALEKLTPIFEKITTPLVLTNGDYQPGNFLAQEGKITGFLDFESPSFRDPLMGFVKYPIYDLVPLSDTDLIEVFLERNGFSRQDFNYRLALGCLKTLVREISVSGGDIETSDYRERVLNILNKAVLLS